MSYISASNHAVQRENFVIFFMLCISNTNGFQKVDSPLLDGQTNEAEVASPSSVSYISITGVNILDNTQFGIKR